MATQVAPESDSEVGVTTLIGGIVHDARELFVEQMSLFQVEVKNDVRRSMKAMIPLVGGLGVAIAGLTVLAFGAVDLLGSLVPDMPRWGGCAAVGGATILVGASLVLIGKWMLDRVNPTPDTALQGLKENLQWKTKK